jgi:arginyl-tRNA synthetase
MATTPPTSPCAGLSARAVAEVLAPLVSASDGVAKAEVAGPGFLNITLESSAIGTLARDIVLAGDACGRTDRLGGLRLNLEFVSANPTGPVHIGGARWAVMGDVLARLLEAAGAVVSREGGHVFQDAGAVWLRTTDFGDDKDRVLVKSDGSWTYFTADCAYYLNKRSRGFKRVVIMLGADHAGYVGRMRAMAACFGDDPDTHLEILIGQLVNLAKDGEPVRMSKRAGTVLTLDDLVEAVGVDAARYALARASVDGVIDLDIDLLTRQSNDNPAYYVQYAHTRLCAVQRRAQAAGIDKGAPQDFDSSLFTHEREGGLLAVLAEFPQVVAAAATLREPHRVAHYLERLADTVHAARLPAANGRIEAEAVSSWARKPSMTTA